MENMESMKNMETMESIDKKKKKASKDIKKKRSKKKKKNKKKVRMKKVKLEDLLDNNQTAKVNNIANLNVQHSNIAPRKSIIGMLRKGLIINNLEESKKNNKTKKGENESHNIQVVIRFRPVNEQEKKIEHRLLFRNEFDMDDKEYDFFLEKRLELINNNEIQVEELNVDQICEWLETIQLNQYKKRFRRRKVNGEWLSKFPSYNEKKPLEYDENKVIVFKKFNNQSKIFEMDKVLKPNTTQDETFKLLGLPVIENIIKGYNCTIIAFGQTGTGKSHSMFGYKQNNNNNDNKNNNDTNDDEYEITFDNIKSEEEEKKQYIINKDEDGLIPRILNDLFSSLSSDCDIAFFTIQCGFIEIYQEKLRDLIRPRLKIQLRYVGMGSELINLSWHDITSYVDLYKLIDICNKNRATAFTLQNETSSRSHCIIQLKIEITLRDGTNQINKISFADLAGSEKLTKTGATGQRLNEAKKIVKSLFAIKKVIRALSEKKAFVPYQDSVLTKLLRDSLGGNSLTMIICTASPHEYNREESISTLRFGVMAKKIQNEAVINRIVSRQEMEQQINNLRDQLQYLRKQKTNTRRRFTSTDFRVLQGQLLDANQKAEEYTQKYLRSEIQLLIKTQYIQELEDILNKKNIQINSLKNKFILLKENKININDIDINQQDQDYQDHQDDQDDAK